MMNFLRKTALWILLLPIAIWGIGVASNQAVLIANHDKFPVMINSARAQNLELRQLIAYQKAMNTLNDPTAKPEDWQKAGLVAEEIEIEQNTGMLDQVHCIMTPETHLNALADIFDFNQEGIYSIGDELLFLGDWLRFPCLLLWGFMLTDKVRKLVTFPVPITLGIHVDRQSPKDGITSN